MKNCTTTRRTENAFGNDDCLRQPACFPKNQAKPNTNNTLHKHLCVKLTIVTQLSFSERIAIANTRFYGDKTLYKNLDLTQDSPNKILFHFLWEQNLLQNLPKIFRWSEMCSLGKILAQDFQMAAVTKILMRREKPIAPLLSLGNKQKTLETQTRTRTR